MEAHAHTFPLPLMALALMCLDCGTTFLINWELITHEYCPGCGRHLHQDAIPERLDAARL